MSGLPTIDEARGAVSDLVDTRRGKPPSDDIQDSDMTATAGTMTGKNIKVQPIRSCTSCSEHSLGAVQRYRDRQT